MRVGVQYYQSISQLLEQYSKDNKSIKDVTGAEKYILKSIVERLNNIFDVNDFEINDKLVGTNNILTEL